jgi:hypothetical protein
MTIKTFGTEDQNQSPRIGDLGNLAFQDGNQHVHINSISTDNFETGFPSKKPALRWDFTSGKLSTGLSFTRSTEATYVDAEGVIRSAAANTPRYDHDPITGEPRGILLEGRSRTNVLTGNSPSAATGSTTNSSTTMTSPDGSSYGVRYISYAGGYAYTGCSNTVGNSSYWTLSMWMRWESGADPRFGIAGTAGIHHVQVHFSTQGDKEVPEMSRASGNSDVDWSYRVEKYRNGWYRVQATWYNTGSTGYQEMQFSGSGNTNYYIWGVQLENAMYASSLIKVNGSAVTRAAESLTKSNFLGDGRGENLTVFIDGENEWREDSGTNFYLFSVNTTDASNRYFGLRMDGTSSRTTWQLYDGTNYRTIYPDRMLNTQGASGTQRHNQRIVTCASLKPNVWSAAGRRKENVWDGETLDVKRYEYDYTGYDSASTSSIMYNMTSISFPGNSQQGECVRIRRFYYWTDTLTNKEMSDLCNLT